MEKEALESYNKAKEVSDKVIEFSKNLIKENEKILDIAESIEKKIFELGAKPAFPVNISINEIAAHYTPDINDARILKLDDLVKVDIGVQVNGYIWDRAFTVCIGKESHDLIKASEKALAEALKVIKPEAKIYEISEVVENTVKEFGFNPVRNLCGHGLEQYNQHAFPSIPNGKNTIKTEIKEDQVIAMEVFVTDGAGLVKESFPTLIFKFKQDRPVRLPEARKILALAKTEFDFLPFTKRWLLKFASPLKIDFALKQLEEVDALHSYPILKEETNGKVAQSEETIIVK
jgi:methionyl aminopeptidase